MDEMNIEITPDMTFAEAEKIPLIAEEGPYMISGPGPYHDQVKDLPLREGTVLGWHWESMADGLNYLIRRAKQGTYRYSVYSKEEQEADPKKADVHKRVDRAESGAAECGQGKTKTAARTAAYSQPAGAPLREGASPKGSKAAACPQRKTKRRLQEPIPWGIL